MVSYLNSIKSVMICVLHNSSQCAREIQQVQVDGRFKFEEVTSLGAKFKGNIDDCKASVNGFLYSRGGKRFT